MAEAAAFAGRLLCLVLVLLFSQHADVGGWSRAYDGSPHVSAAKADLKFALTGKPANAVADSARAGRPQFHVPPASGALAPRPPFLRVPEQAAAYLERMPAGFVPVARVRHLARGPPRAAA